MVSARRSSTSRSTRIRFHFRQPSKIKKICTEDKGARSNNPSGPRAALLIDVLAGTTARHWYLVRRMYVLYLVYDTYSRAPPKARMIPIASYSYRHDLGTEIMRETRQRWREY